MFNTPFDSPPNFKIKNTYDEIKLIQEYSK